MFHLQAETANPNQQLNEKLIAIESTDRFLEDQQVLQVSI